MYVYSQSYQSQLSVGYRLPGESLSRKELIASQDALLPVASRFRGMAGWKGAQQLSTWTPWIQECCCREYRERPTSPAMRMAHTVTAKSAAIPTFQVVRGRSTSASHAGQLARRRRQVVVKARRFTVPLSTKIWVSTTQIVFRQVSVHSRRRFLASSGKLRWGANLDDRLIC
jgi:hypothetical protein